MDGVPDEEALEASAPAIGYDDAVSFQELASSDEGGLPQLLRVQTLVDMVHRHRSNEAILPLMLLHNFALRVSCCRTPFLFC
jgi:hypothetical protein